MPKNRRSDIERAVLEEREACAKLVDRVLGAHQRMQKKADDGHGRTFASGGIGACELIAEKIRAGDQEMYKQYK